ncbi:septation ring formation regulator EzrA [Pseudogracilibacillus auburnensis]|uniref:Septation ring formation regulator EzrA n=1 Tax=Pseudogracilibacillus auburnensis TaxID=1494959 RepID=A0A2V3VUI7_9BACI|nr:septation ring formation regulator EzrA [Pseudogracilibacillus auburnensis]MBO1003357.1 septation ring formation regulator EzrA [Pseudogracilibacillus auburnensis]PXW85340.1 septation ring formation regulator [Pseudogracilibacillus auburnensis]
MEYVIGAILAVIVLIIVGLLLRKRLYDSVDYYESWKLDIMNRNVASELAKVKELNLEGETKEKFEQWKNKWETILTVELGKVEELLYDTENAADRYSFPAAKKCMKQMEEILQAVEKKIETILAELNELLEIEQSNREEVEQLEPKLNELRKILSQNRYQYDRADVRFEVEFDEIQKELTLYKELVAEGNYIQSTEVVDQVKKRLEALQQELEEFPALYKLCRQGLPTQLDELYKGLNEMKAEGYWIDHLDLEKEIKEFQAQLIDLVHALEKESTNKVKEMVPEIEERVKEMYLLLEKEALAKNFVESKMPSYERALENFEVQFLHTKSEVAQLKQAYYFEDSDLEKYMSLEKMVTQLQEQLKTFAQKVEKNNSAHSKLRTELEQGFQQLENIVEEHQDFKSRIQNLRKDEVEARAQLQSMSDDIFKTNRKLRNSNLPGVPNFIWSMIEEATEKNELVLQALDNQPLDILEVQKSLAEAKSSVMSAIENTNMMLEQAYLTEQVIQYANRYRSSNPSLAAKLLEAEQLFRKAEYELALENAANAIEEIEPGALKKIEKHQEMTVS